MPRTVLIIAGAGASSLLGADRNLPLMDGWMNDLVVRMNREKQGLADALGLRLPSDGVGGEYFEECLGTFLAFQRHLPTIARLSRLGSTDFVQRAVNFEEWAKAAADNVQYVRNALHESLHSLFDYKRVSNFAARRAYEPLIQHVRAQDSETHLIFATTNYDCAIEIALEEMDITAETGERHRMSNLRRPVDPVGIADDVSLARSPVLHLHGRIGWYEDEHGVAAIDPRQPLDLERAPALLLPDKNKDYSTFPVLEQMWNELDRAIAKVRETNGFVLVIGHSLNDKALVTALTKGAPVFRIVMLLPEGYVLPTGATVTTADLTQQCTVLIEKLIDPHFCPGAFGPDWNTEGLNLGSTNWRP